MTLKTYSEQAPITPLPIPLRRRPWFGKRKLAVQPALDADYRVSEFAFEGDVTDFSVMAANRQVGIQRARTVEKEDCNLVTSKLPNGKHAVVLDLDFPAELVESRTEGHFHLYLDTQKQLPWKQYKRLLKVLAEAGLIEQGYYNASVARKATMVRPPVGVQLEDGPWFQFYDRGLADDINAPF